MTEHLDDKEFPLYTAASAGLSELSTLRKVPNIAAEKDEFLYNAGQKDPVLTPELDMSLVTAKTASLSVLRDHITEDKHIEPMVREAYLPVVEEGLATCAMLAAAHMGDVDAYKLHNQKLYGDVDTGVFNYCLDFFAQLVASNRSSRNVFVRTAARQAEEILPEVREDITGVWPNARQFQAVKALYRPVFEQIRKGVQIPNVVTSDEAIDLIPQMAGNYGLPQYTARLRKDKTITTMATLTSEAVFLVPQAQEYEAIRFIGLDLHEMTHAVEAVNGETQPLLLLSKGLHKYLRASEGKGVAAEQMAYPVLGNWMETLRFVDLARRYLAIGLTTGADSHGERSFKQVFKIVNAIDRLWEIEHDQQHPNEAGKQAIDRTWELLTQRTNKGPVGKGSAHCKDKVYLEGNVEQLRLLVTAPEAFPYLNLGKYDLTNPDHINTLRSVRLLPRKLSTQLLRQAVSLV